MPVEDFIKSIEKINLSASENKTVASFQKEISQSSDSSEYNDSDPTLR